MSKQKPVYVTSPTLPPLAELVELLEETWSTRILTNMGPMHRRFEEALVDYLGVQHITLVTNATIGLMLAIRHTVAGGDEAEVITTPFSFVATANSIVWAGATPVFADIEAKTLNIDPAQIERRITPRTKAILAVHCYGQPCKTAEIEQIANHHDLKVIYDAAHAFGASHEGRSLASFGDLSVLSFHATKVFNTFEGGAIVCPNKESKHALDRLSNHGIEDESNVPEIGLNGKMSEFNAAVGLLQLKYLTDVIAQRRRVVERYLELLSGIRGIRCLMEREFLTDSNHYAFPILIEPDCAISCPELQARLREQNIYARRYFHPLISELPKYTHLRSANPDHLPVATAMASQVLCLPLFPSLEPSTQTIIAEVISSACQHR